ncbi:hypothetical protein [Streptomyces ehimensis]|uniref:Uncharacterized protein n=1 Tax=Streptomyces ehimensis TaxID=68195 RepID=A0ABV9BBQ7_9ACTN
MDEPVFVIHGVGNRDLEGFIRTVATLAAASGLDLVPVHWGDLGADDRYVDLALPPTRGDASRIPLASLLERPPGLRAPDVGLPDPLRDAFRDSLGVSLADDGLRDGPGRPDVEEILAVLEEEWPATRWLGPAGDPELLRATGAALARAVLEAEEAGEAENDDGLRGRREAAARLRTVIRHRLQDLDRVAGAAMEAVADRVNHQLRSHYGPGATRFLGDVLVYQRHRAAIHARVRQCVDAVDPELGKAPSRPVRLVAHSLGGVIAVDLATAAEPLWTSALLTFGSQPAYFHLCDPRGGQLSPYASEQPVCLPPSLARWTNLWQPLDPLAFAASRVFRLADGTPPTDVTLPHTFAVGLWTHSVYWQLPELADLLRAIFPAAT